VDGINPHHLDLKFSWALLDTKELDCRRLSFIYRRGSALVNPMNRKMADKQHNCNEIEAFTVQKYRKSTRYILAFVGSQILRKLLKFKKIIHQNWYMKTILVLFSMKYIWQIWLPNTEYVNIVGYISVIVNLPAWMSRILLGEVESHFNWKKKNVISPTTYTWRILLRCFFVFHLLLRGHTLHVSIYGGGLNMKIKYPIHLKMAM
jgi:hypothetical protein